MRTATGNLQFVKKAYFQLDAKGQRTLKIWQLGRVDVINLDCEWNLSRARILHKDELEYCLAIGFQHDTYPIDNRTEEELKKDWEKEVERRYFYELSPARSFEEWKAKIELSF